LAEGRFVNDDGRGAAGRGGGEVNGDQGAEAGAEDRGGPCAEGRDEQAEVVAVAGDGGFLAGIVQAAAGVAAPAVGDDGLVVCQAGGERPGRVGIGRAAAEEHECWAAALGLVVPAAAGNLDVAAAGRGTGWARAARPVAVTRIHRWLREACRLSG
jgi:hypothetical protein